MSFLTLAYCIALLIGVATVIDLVFSGPRPVLCDHILLGVVFLLLAFLWFATVRESQLAPHKITRSIGSQVLQEFWATNNEFITYSNVTVVTASGLDYRVQPVTNEYWHIWGIFK